MDLSKFDASSAADEGVAMIVQHPIDDTNMLDEETGESVVITLIGQDSKSVQKLVHKITNRKLARTFKRGRGISIKAEQIDTDALEILATCTKAWEGIVVDGEKLQCTFENAKKVYERFPWLREQVDDFTTDRANFLGN